MDPVHEDPLPPPSRWRAHGRPALARVVGSGVAMAGAVLPLAVTVRVAIERDAETCAMLVAFFAGVAAVAGAPGVAVEAWAGRRAGRPRSVIAPVACGVLVPLLLILLGVQLNYARAVIAGGVDSGLDGGATLIADALDEPGTVIAIGGGLLFGLGAPTALVVAMRLRRVRAWRQALIGFFLVLAAGLASGGAGAVVLASLAPASVDIAEVLSMRPLLGGLTMASVMTGFFLLFVGLGSTLLLPPALALADRFRDRD